MRTASLAALACAAAGAAAGACRVGPVKLGMMPRMAPIGQSRDPDPTRMPVEPAIQPSGEHAPSAPAAGSDPLTVGPVSGGVTVASLFLWQLLGVRPMLGLYGTFDETGLIEAAPARKPASKSKPAPRPPVD